MDKLIYETIKKKIKGDISFYHKELKQYCTDKSYFKGIAPAFIVKIACANDVKEVLSIANEFKIPITVRGAGSGKSGGAIPEFNGLVLSFENMNKIIELDSLNSCITVEPGVILDDIKTHALQNNLFYPVETSSSDWCTIGGNVATNSGGANSLKYGVTKDYVMALEGYFGDGTFFRLGRKCHKDVAGYNLKELLVGSEGTLAIITKITLKLISKPSIFSSYWIQCDSLQKAIDFLQHCKLSGINFSAAEFMEPNCLISVEKYLQQSFDFLSGHAVLLSFDSESQETIDKVTQYLNKMTRSTKFRSTLYLDNLNDFWLVRRSVSEALAVNYKNKFSEDITIPIGQISKYFDFIKSLQTDSINIVGYGHLGDGNIHTNLLNIDLEEHIWHVKKEKLIDEIMNYCVAVGGTLTGEHGIGLTKKKYMSLYFSDFEIALMKKIKKSVDPNLILNPSKLF